MIGLALSTVSGDGFVDNHFNATLDIAPKIGFKYIEFNCWHASDLTPANIKNLKRRCSDLGLTPISVYGGSFGFSGWSDVGKDVGHKIRMIEAALELGCYRIVATGAARGQMGGVPGVIKTLEQITPFAEACGVLICLENHANNNLEFIEDYDAIFTAIPSPNVGLCVDTGHFEGSKVSLDEVADHFAGKINHIHVKEATAWGVPRFVRFGEGVTDNNRLVERVLAHGFDGFISVELAIEDKSNLLNDLKKPYEMFARYER